MNVSKIGKFDTTGDKTVDGAIWPNWAKIAVSLVLAFQIASVIAGALAAPPSSPLERGVVQVFSTYHQWTDQGYAYRYYAPEPGPTPVATARIAYADGRSEENVRLPQRGLWPRIRYQRQLALANHLANDASAARALAGDSQKSRWARSYARHLARTHAGSSTVSLFLQSHLIPDPERVRQALDAKAKGGIDLDAEEFFTTPERIGEYQCDGL